MSSESPVATVARQFEIGGEFKSADCPRVITGILDTFLSIRQGDETLSECVRRTGFGL